MSTFSRARTPWIAGALVALVTAAADAQESAVVPLANAHSHNDYYQAQPLERALSLGFCSIEADVYPVDGDLLVAHDREELPEASTLREQYLEPLFARATQNHGRVYPDGPTVILLVDIKDDAEGSYAILQELLEPHRDLLTRFTNNSTDERAVTIVLSGDRPIHTVDAQDERWVGIDGRLPDLHFGASRHLMPMISAAWASAFVWKGEGTFAAHERQKLKGIVEQAEAGGHVLRFWGLPDGAAMWPTLHEAGVDLLNADDLAALQTYLLESGTE